MFLILILYNPHLFKIDAKETVSAIKNDWSEGLFNGGGNFNILNTIYFCKYDIKII